jgi:type IV secretory pathway VirB2 component (pilin)
MPDWVQKLYWYWHGPVGHAQPRAKGYVDMSASAVVSFFAVEAVLFAVLMIILWGISKLVTDGELAKWLRVIAIVVIGTAMLLKLLGFAGVM